MKEVPYIAAVIIGRNEGERLLRCLASVSKTIDRVVYVDSGSTDGSVAAAKAAGAETIDLDRSKPFTAARARNAGIRALRRGAHPDYVQFIDGDCELKPDWVAIATAFFNDNPMAAVVCGRRRERFPEISVYNRLCDREWDTPIGRTRSCGGDSLMRWTALDEVGGFNPSLIAGEEPELCVRLRARAWEVWRLDAEMTLHDAAMTRFSQWWKRSRRGGYAAAEGMAMHGKAPERHGIPQVRRAVFWTMTPPLTAFILFFMSKSWIIAPLLLYPIQTVRLATRKGGKKEDWEEAFFMVLSKFPEFLGVLEFWTKRALRRPGQIIEYK